ARDLAIIVRVEIGAFGARGAFAFGALAPLRALVRTDHAVIVRIKAREHLRGPREEFLARDRAVIVGIRAIEAHAAMTAAMAALAALGAHFFTRDLAVMIGVKRRETRRACGV